MMLSGVLTHAPLMVRCKFKYLFLIMQTALCKKHNAVCITVSIEDKDDTTKEYG